MGRKEATMLQEYIDDGADSWRFAGFISSAILIIVSFLSTAAYLLEFNIMMASLNLFTLAFGCASICLEYRTHWLTKDFVSTIKREVSQYLSNINY